MRGRETKLGKYVTAIAREREEKVKNKEYKDYFIKLNTNRNVEALEEERDWRTPLLPLIRPLIMNAMEELNNGKTVDIEFNSDVFSVIMDQSGNIVEEDNAFIFLNDREYYYDINFGRWELC